MPDRTLSIEDWKHLSETSPSKAAARIHQSIAELPAETKKAVFSYVFEESRLEALFESNAGSARDAFSGVPFLLKDLFDVAGLDTAASSTFLPRIRPKPQRNGAMAQSFLKNGAVLAGKTHLNEFAYGLSGENPHFGNCPHPVHPERLSGGSSSGSAFAVKKGIVPIASGTDTGGSIRVPAAWCGIYGIRFSPNKWSLEGCFPLAPSFDTAGWFCQTAKDMAFALEHLAPFDKKDSPSKPKGLNLLPACPEIGAQWRPAMEDAVEKLDTETNPDLAETFKAARTGITRSYSVLQSIDALGVHQEWLDEFQVFYDPAVWQRIDRARHWSPEDIANAKQAEKNILAFFEIAFSQYDFVVLPATQSPAISAGEHTDLFRNQLLELTAPGSFARCPTLTLPINLPTGESLGLQILYRDESSRLPLSLLQSFG